MDSNPAPLISFYRLCSYLVAAGSTVVLYDWALTFEKEFELILSRRWSFMTVLYICVRYIGILFSVMNILSSLLVPMTDIGCTVVWFIQTWTPIPVNAMLGVIMIARLYAMYRESKKLLVFLVVALLASTITSGVLMVYGGLGVSGQETDLSGYHTCTIQFNPGTIYLAFESVIPAAVWEILALFLTIWIIIKYFRELRQSPTGSTIGGCLTILIESHAFYFLSFAIVACFVLGTLSPNLMVSFSTGSAVYTGFLSIAQMLQMFVLGPRLILTVREHYAKVAASADEGLDMTVIAFQASGHTPTSGDV